MLDVKDLGDEYQELTAVLHRGSRIAGRVVDQDDHPVVGILMTIDRGFPSGTAASDDESWSVSVASTNTGVLYARPATSGNDGKFVADGLLEGPHLVTIRTPGYSFEGGTDGVRIVAPATDIVFVVAMTYVCAIIIDPEQVPFKMAQSLLSFPIKIPDGTRLTETLETRHAVDARQLIRERLSGRDAIVVVAKARRHSDLPRNVALETRVPMSIAGAKGVDVVCRFLPLAVWAAPDAVHVSVDAILPTIQRVRVRAPSEMILWNRGGGFAGAPFYQSFKDNDWQVFFVPPGEYAALPDEPHLLKLSKLPPKIVVGSETIDIDLSEHTVVASWVTIRIVDAAGRASDQFGMSLEREDREFFVQGAQVGHTLHLPAAEGDVKLRLFDPSGRPVLERLIVVTSVDSVEQLQLDI